MSSDIKEQIRLVNGISFLGVPISLTFVVLFAITGHLPLMLAFLFGVIIFSSTLLFTKIFGLNFSRNFVCVMAPVVFGAASVIGGKDTGFFLGFLVISVPPIIVYPKIKQGVVLVIFCIFLLALTIVGNVLIAPIDPVPFAMTIFLFNLLTVLVTGIGIVTLFKAELNESRKKLFEKNKEITDSINYAKKIQSAYMPNEDIFHRVYEDAFLLFKPKDIVSGDFYWFYTLAKNEKPAAIRHCAVADCTGHGVPGALMSVICSNALNETVVHNKIYDTDKILNETRRIVKRNLKTKKYQERKDGMDIALITINFDTLELWYSGAYNPAWVLKNGKMLELAADKQPIGVFENEKDFSQKYLKLNKGDIIYLFSDGYADQFGGPKGKKFKYKQLNELMVSISHLSMNEQKNKLDSVFDEWKGNLEQVDDVCIIGIKI